RHNKELGGCIFATDISDSSREFDAILQSEAADLRLEPRTEHSFPYYPQAPVGESASNPGKCLDQYLMILLDLQTADGEQGAGRSGGRNIRSYAVRQRYRIGHDGQGAPDGLGKTGTNGF